jgi:hypothetical protein
VVFCVFCLQKFWGKPLFTSACGAITSPITKIVVVIEVVIVFFFDKNNNIDKYINQKKMLTDSQFEKIINMKKLKFYIWIKY